MLFKGPYLGSENGRLGSERRLKKTFLLDSFVGWAFKEGGQPPGRKKMGLFFVWGGLK